MHVRLAQEPLSIDGQQVGALYVEVPLGLFTIPAHLDMFDGRGYFMLFEADTGEILVPPSEKAQTPLTSDMSVYDFLESASEYRENNSLDSVEDASEALLALEARQGSDLAGLKKAVGGGETGLVTSPFDGKASYVCMAPVHDGRWYVCSVVPVDNVRAEAQMVATTFGAVFGIVLACLVVVALLAFNAYRRRVRERNVAMMSQLYKALSDSIEMAVNLYSPSDGQVTPIVAKAANIIGYSLRDFLHDEQLAEDIGLSDTGTRMFERVRAGEVRNFEQGEFEFRNPKTGMRRWVSYAVRPLVFDGKHQLLVVLRDATADKAIQASMKEAMDAAEAANEAKSEFLSRMSHEIRTPMNVIIGMVQIARANADDLAKLRVSLAKIGAASDHLLGLINDVLDISKIENGKMTLVSEPFRMSGIFEHVTTVIRAQCEQRGLRFEVKAPRGSDVVFVGDPVRLKQLLLNLLSNAVKYTPKGGCVRFEATVASTTVMGYRRVEFTIADNGIGMSEEFQKRLFEPFAMEGRSREQGTGLGMPIVKNIVSLMGGEIEFDSAVGQGTVYKVTLNLRIALEVERKVFEEEALRMSLQDAGANQAEEPEDASGLQTVIPVLSATVPSAIDRNELEGLRVLVAEDNELNAEIAIELLSEAGLVVERAADGREACDLFEASPMGHFDVVLMDVQMPVMDGYEATRCIRSLDRPDAQRVPIIAMSANAFSEDVKASLASGMDAHLSKPIDVRRVLASIAHYVRKRANMPSA